jgi:hypothetical protein
VLPRRVGTETVTASGTPALPWATTTGGALLLNMLVVNMEVQQPPRIVFYNVYDTYTIDYYFIPGQLWATQNTDSAVSMKTQIQIIGATIR